jgi:hypothetical protein
VPIVSEETTPARLTRGLRLFIAGVMYALEEYNRLATVAPKQKQTESFYSKELEHLLSAVQDAKALPTNWLRGFFYNAAAMRLDAAWERSLRVILKDSTKKRNLRKLYNKVRGSKPSLPEYDDSICNQVRNEVNDLKHQDKGPSEDIRENPEVLREGLKQLLDLLNPRNDSLRSNKRMERTLKKRRSS